MASKVVKRAPVAPARAGGVAILSPAERQRQMRARQYRGSHAPPAKAATKRRASPGATSASTDDGEPARKRARSGAKASPRSSGPCSADVSDASPSPSLSSTRRCCKADLTRNLAENELLELLRVDQCVLDEHNGGVPIRAHFANNQLIDVDTQKAYRSVSKWVKERLIDVGALSPKSNISGWDWVAVNRNGVLTSLRLLGGAHAAGASPASFVEAHEMHEENSAAARHVAAAAKSAPAARRGSKAPTRAMYDAVCAERNALRIECEKLRRAADKASVHRAK